jgi:glutamate synthase (ferredoxin)
MVALEKLEDPEEIADLQEMIAKHASYTASATAQAILDDWEANVPLFVKVMPKDYKRVLQAIQAALQSGLTGDEALAAAFEANAKDVARIGGS